MTRWATVGSVFVVTGLLVACGGGDSGEGASPSNTESIDVTATTQPPAAETTTTTVAATTTAAPTTTTEPAPVPDEGIVGLVWESVVDDGRVNTGTPMPVFDADGIASRIQSILLVQSGAANEIQRECRDEAASRQDFEGGELATQCLVVQWAFDVAPDFRVDQNSPDGGLIPDALVTVDGNQIDSGFIASGFPGTVDNGIVNIYSGGTAPATLRFQTGSNLVGYTTHIFEVPGADVMAPIFFDLD